MVTSLVDQKWLDTLIAMYGNTSHGEPWAYDGKGYTTGDSRYHVLRSDGVGMGHNNAHFIVALHNSFPELVELAEKGLNAVELEKKNRLLTEAVDILNQRLIDRTDASLAKTNEMHLQIMKLEEEKRQLQLGVNPNAGPILFYEMRFYPFSNFSAFSVFWNTKWYQTSEHLYQALKFSDLMIHENIRRQSSAHLAMIEARAMKEHYRPDWEEIKADVMYQVCKKKASQHPYVTGKLKESGSRELIESSPVDSFWGWGPDRKGRNELGKIWMRLRDELNAGTLVITEQPTYS